MFPGLSGFLTADNNCKNCYYRSSYGAEVFHQFGGVELCDDCKVKWRAYLELLPERATRVFPEIFVNDKTVEKEV